jgi:hypothetical protein
MTYLVTIPIAGHITFEVDAESESDAIDAAMKMDENEGELSWETLRKFHQGNYCFCPFPWEAKAESID